MAHGSFGNGFFALNSTGNLSVMLSDSKVTSRKKFLNQNMNRPKHSSPFVIKIKTSFQETDEWDLFVRSLVLIIT